MMKSIFVTVGMPVAGHPPHGSGREDFLHPALALGADDKALIRVRVNDPD